jgi:hypothetical protein
MIIRVPHRQAVEGLLGARQIGKTTLARQVAGSRAAGVAWSMQETGSRFLDLLTSTFMIRQLPAWHENLGKRQVKAPKVYFRDSGLLHNLIDARTREDLEQHPRAGASWEGFAMEEAIRLARARPEECHFWATHSGAELDLLIVRGRRREGFEFKRTTAPGLTASMRIALEDLELDRLTVVHTGRETVPLAGRVRAVPLSRLAAHLRA